MKFKTLFFLFFFGILGFAKTSFSQTIIFQEHDLLQGVVLPVTVTSNTLPPQIKSMPAEGNELTLEEINGNQYLLHYTPAADFLGDDGFSIEATVSFDPINPSQSEKLLYIVTIEVQESMVKSHDDFVQLNSQDDIIINVLSNDEASSTELTVTLAHVLKGDAVVNEDQTITYTPTEESNDYIVYSVSDENNAISSSTVYISQDTEITESLTTKSYSVASGKSQYIILPNSDFTLVDNIMDYGEIVQVNDFVYKYTANQSIEGTEVIDFVNDDDNLYVASILILEKYEDGGFVKDDVFHSASNTNLVFDVSANDVFDQYVIADHSPELIYLGGGQFSYTPPPYFSGTKEFSYTADDGFMEETGSITLVISNYKPTNYFEYNLSTALNQPRIIEYDVPLGTEYFEVVSLPLHGSVEIFTEDESVDVGCEEGIQKVFVLYTPDSDYVGDDNLVIKYCASDNNVCNDISILMDVVDTEIEDCLCIDDCVWPGDANGDGKVSVVDALTIGRYIGNGGSPRDASPYGDIYEGSSAENWGEVLANGKDLKHADANGDGFITSEDLDVVVDNYGEINSVISTDILGVKNLPFLLSTEATEIDSGDFLVIDVTMGSEAYPAIDIHGVSFAVNLPASLVDSASVEVEYLESGYFVKGAPYISLTHQPSAGIIHTAGTKTNSIGSTGSGIIATVSFIVVDDAEGIKDNKRSVASIIEDAIATINVTDIIIEDSRGYKYALPNTSLDLTINSGDDTSLEVETALDVYPNPASDAIFIGLDNEEIIRSVKLFALDGQTMKSINAINANSTQMQVEQLPAGIYIVKAFTEHNTYSTKIFKQ